MHKLKVCSKPSAGLSLSLELHLALKERCLELSLFLSRLDLHLRHIFSLLVPLLLRLFQLLLKLVAISARIFLCLRQLSLELGGAAFFLVDPELHVGHFEIGLFFRGLYG